MNKRKKVLLEQFRPGIFLQIREKDGPSNSGTLVPLKGDRGEIRIGRASHNDVIIDNPLVVSRKHAVLAWAGDKYLVRDLGSTIGTFVNGQRISDPQELAVDGIFTVGEVEFVIRKNPPLKIHLRGESSVE